MKFATDRAALAVAAELAGRIVEPKSPIPALACARLRADAGRVHIYAADLILSAETSFPAAIAEPGEICVPASAFVDAIAAMPRGATTIETAPPASIAIVGGRRTMVVHAIGADQYPATPKKPATRATVSARELRELLRSGGYAFSTDKTRPHLGGVKLETVAGLLHAVSTDGYRLAVASVRTDSAAINVLLPGRLVSEALKQLDGVTAESAEITWTESKAWISVGDVVLCGSSTELTFPPWQAAVPGESKRKARVSRTALDESVRSVLRLSSDRSSAVRLGVEASSIVVSYSDPDRGRGRDSVDAELEGEPIEIAVNGRYLCDALGSLSTDEAFLEFGVDHLEPLVVKPTSDTNQIGVVMPTRI